MAASELSTTSLISDPNLQGYWRFENNSNDSSINGYNLTNSGSPTYTAGEFGNGITFVAASLQFASIADASCPNLEITGSQTWGAWIKPASIPGVQATFMAKCNVGGTVFVLLLLDSSQKLDFHVTGLSTNTHIMSDVTINTGSWSFIVGRYDATAQTLSIFVNNVKKSVTASGSHDDTNATFTIGKESDFTTPYYFDGMIDDAFVFNRALNDSEINRLYTGWSSGGSFIYQLI